MDYKKQIIEKIESFYVDVVDEFKEAEMKIISDSRFRRIFKKKDYDGNIEHLKKCKKRALSIDVNDIEIPDNDSLAHDVLKAFEKCLVHFNNLCDTHTRLQLGLKNKAENKEALTFAEHKELFQKVQMARNSMNGALHELDILYTDFSYEEDDEDSDIKYVE